MKKIMLFAALAPLSLYADSAPKGSFAVGPQVSTLGIGLNAVYSLTPMFKIRGQVNGFKIKRNFKDSGNGVDYSGNLRLLTAGGILDIHPFENGFKLSAGAFYNGNRLDVNATPNKNITIDGHTYTPAQIGTLNGRLDFRKVSPYLAIGYDNAFTNDGNLSFNAEVGVLFQGSPRGNLTATGALQNSAQMLSDFKKDAEAAANKGYIRAYPVVSIGFKCRF